MMNAAIMGAAMKSAIDALTDEQKQDRSEIFEALASAIIAHLTTNAVVAVASVSGVTTGAGVSGPGVGTIS